MFATPDLSAILLAISRWKGEISETARDAAATMWAVAALEQVGVARDLLGHADMRMTA